MSEEKLLLMVRLNVHCDQRATRGEQDDVLVSDARPFQTQTLRRRVAYDVSKFHDWILIQLWIDLSLFANEHASSVGI